MEEGEGVRAYARRVWSEREGRGGSDESWAEGGYRVAGVTRPSKEAVKRFHPSAESVRVGGKGGVRGGEVQL